MINIAAKSTKYVQASATVVSAGVKPLAAGVIPKKTNSVAAPQANIALGCSSLNNTLPIGNICVTSGLSGTYYP